MKSALGYGSEKGNRGRPALTAAQRNARPSHQASVRRFRAAHPERVKEQTHRSTVKWRTTYPERYLWHSARSGAKKRGIEFSISSDDLLPLPVFCPILGLSLIYKGAEPGRISAASATLDRRDNSKGYVKGNVFVISWRANKIKADATASELAAIATYAGAS